jgi:hypothetical protein
MQNGGVGTAEPGMGILEENIRGCDWKCKCDTEGRLHASAEYIPEGVV